MGMGPAPSVTFHPHLHVKPTTTLSWGHILSFPQNINMLQNRHLYLHRPTQAVIYTFLQNGKKIKGSLKLHKTFVVEFFPYSLFFCRVVWRTWMLAHLQISFCHLMSLDSLVRSFPHLNSSIRLLLFLWDPVSRSASSVLIEFSSLI